jgi:hypothetical protein
MKIDYLKRDYSNDQMVKTSIDVDHFNKSQISFIEALIELNSFINDGRGAGVIFSVLSYLNQNDIESASAAVGHDLDKIRCYDNMYKFFKLFWDKTFPNNAKIYWGYDN